MMKKLSFVLCLVMILTILAGCAVEEKLDHMEDRAEAYIENQEEKAERYIASAGEKLMETVRETGNEIAGETSQAGLTDSPVTKEQAEQIALEYAGLTRDQVTGVRSNYEIDDGVSKYEIEFRKDGWEYEFEIHEKTGKILSYDKDRERY